MFKRIPWTLVMSPLLMASLLAPQVALAGTGGQAGNTSGFTNSTSTTTFSVPVTVSAPGAGGFQPVSGNVQVTVANGQVTVTAPPAIVAAVAAAGTNAVITFSTGTLSQQQIAALVGGNLTIVDSLGGEVPAQILIESSEAGNITGSETVNSLSEAFGTLSQDIDNVTGTNALRLQVGDTSVLIESAQ